MNEKVKSEIIKANPTTHESNACTDKAPPELVVKNLAANASPSSVPSGLYCAVRNDDK